MRLHDDQPEVTLLTITPHLTATCGRAGEAKSLRVIM
jgi:hypothetical protein